MPVSDQVLIRVEACGVCHTDVDLRRGLIGGMKVETIGLRTPMTLGHEVSGTVEEVGPDALGVAKGDRVLVDWVSGDGTCEFCLAGEEISCNKVRFLGINMDGGYAEKVLVPHSNHLHKITKLSPADAAPFADAGFTAYSAALKGRVSEHNLVAVVGLGGVGLMAVQMSAKVLGANVVAIGKRNETLDSANKLGASKVISSDKEDTLKEVMRYSGGKGADVVIDLVCSDQTLRMYPGVLAKGGRYVMVGLFGGNMSPLPSVTTLRNLSIIGSNYGNRNLFEKVVALAESGKVQSVTTSTLKLDQANQAIDNLEKDRVVGRQVVTP